MSTLLSEQSFRSMIFGSAKKPNLAQELSAINDDAEATRATKLRAEDAYVRDYIISECYAEARKASENRYITISAEKLYGWDTPLTTKFKYNNPDMRIPSGNEIIQICERVATNLSSEGLSVVWHKDGDDGDNLLEIRWGYGKE